VRVGSTAPNPKEEVTVYAPKITRAGFALGAAGAALFMSLALWPSRAAAADDAAKRDAASKGKTMPSYPALMEMKPEDVMHMMDGDHSGYVTREEFTNFFQAEYDRLDRDRDQRLTAPEFTDRG
jgi:hypothetical protein